VSKCKYGCKNGRIFTETNEGGAYFMDCPECSNVEKVLEKVDEEVGISLYDKLSIPENYRGVQLVKREVLQFDNDNLYAPNSIQQVGKLLDRIVETIYNHRKLLNMSVFIYGGTMSDMKSYVYSTQKVALEKGLTTVPFISLNTLYGIQRLLDCTANHSKILERFEKGALLESDYADLPVVEGLKFSRYTGLTYFDFINADLCFVEISSNSSKGGGAALADLLSERAKHGLPTYVISYWPSGHVKHPSFGGIQFLFMDTGYSRLDKLNIYEISRRRGYVEGESWDFTVNETLSKSKVTAGLDLKDFMNDN
jgi:hypothetical protein